MPSTSSPALARSSTASPPTSAPPSSPDDGFASYFLDVFGRPRRESVCECERLAEANLSQTLHLLNSGEVQGKVGMDKGRAVALVEDRRIDAEKVRDLYRIALARAPTDEEAGECLDYLARRRDSGREKQGFEDLIWTLVNTKEFLFIQ